MTFRPILALTAMSLLLLPSCRKDPPTPPTLAESGMVRVRLVPEWEGQPFQLFVENENISGYRVQVERVRFYLSALRLVRSQQSHEMAEVAYINFENGPFDTLVQAPAGDWTALSMGLGLPYDLNHSDPLLYANDHPLSSSNGMHWDWTQGYIFTKFEGRHDTIPGSSGAFPLTFSIHTGFDTAFAAVILAPSGPINVIKDDTTTITVRVAIDRFFHSDEGGTIDLATEYMSHGTNVPLSMKLSRNVANSFTID